MLIPALIPLLAGLPITAAGDNPCKSAWREAVPQINQQFLDAGHPAFILFFRTSDGTIHNCNRLPFSKADLANFQ